MPRKLKPDRIRRTRWAPEEDAIIRDNFATVFAADIAAMLPGRTTKSVHHRAKVLGLWMDGATHGELSTKRFESEIESRLGEPIAVWLRRRYVDEGATYRQLCAELGANTRTIMRWMRESGIEPISPEVAARRHMERNPDAITRMLAPEPQARRRISAAKSRQVNWEKNLTSGESALLNAMTDAGLAPTPQLAVDGYNIDFAFPGAMLAVEYDPCWHDTRVSDRRRDARLRELGWTVLRLEARTSLEYNVAKVSSALQSLAATQPR